jgi:hypothetical protein
LLVPTVALDTDAKPVNVNGCGERTLDREYNANANVTFLQCPALIVPSWQVTACP